MCPVWAETSTARLRAVAYRTRPENCHRRLPALLVRMATGSDEDHQSLRPRSYQPRSAGLSDGQHERLLLRFERTGPDRHLERGLDQVVNPAFAAFLLLISPN